MKEKIGASMDSERNPWAYLKILKGEIRELLRLTGGKCRS